MSQSMGTLDFFLLEGGEYLERLDALVQTPAGPFSQSDELLRLSRAFRGSAIMASQHGMARAAQGLESCARALREGRLGWTEATRGELLRSIDDCKILMRRLRTPEPGDTEKAEAIGIQLDRLSGRASAAMRAAAGPGLDAGGRAFVAREAASIASVLQHAARTLRSDHANRDVLVSISPAMSALRGVAILNDLPPLGDILSALEHAAKDVMAAAGALGADGAEVFEAGAKALARAAREVVDLGRPDAEAGESHAFTARLFSALTAGGPVVGVESLFYDDAGPHVVTRGEAPPMPGAGTGLARVEMVSQGEYLQAASAELERAASHVERDLRLYVIAARMRPMMTAGGAPLAGALGRLAVAMRDGIGRGAASTAIDEFNLHLREAAAVLTGADSGDEEALAGRLDAAATAIAALTAKSRTRDMRAVRREERETPMTAPAVRTPAPAPAAPPPAVPERAPAPTPAPMAAAIEPPPVPPEPPRPRPSAPAVVEAAVPAEPLPEPPRPAPVPVTPVAGIAPTPAPADARPPRQSSPDGADIAASYLGFEQLITERGLPMGSLAELVAGGVTVPPSPAPESRTTRPRLTAVPERPVVPVAALAPDDDGVVAVESLLYRGDAALRRALELKRELAAATSAGATPARLNALINEVFDLVELGLGSGR